jgi:hypothetical protein
VGTKQGFVEGAARIFSSSSSSADYHESMDSQYFEEWFDMLSRSLKQPTVILLDNAPYHSRIVNKQPSSSWRKAEIISWLKKNECASRPQLFKNRSF